MKLLVKGEKHLHNRRKKHDRRKRRSRRGRRRRRGAGRIMPVSPARLVTVRAPATVYRMMVFKFGGSEPTFAESGFGSYGYVAGILLGPNPTLFWDTVFGDAESAADKMGFYKAADLVVVLQWLFNNFDPKKGDIEMYLEQKRNPTEFKVAKVDFKGGE